MDALVRKPRVAALLRLVPIAALVVVATFAGPRRPPEPRVLATAASGNVELADSRGGDAIVSADDMQPGRSVSGTVTIRNSGDAAAALTLSKSDLVDSPGSGGGRLSEALFLTVDDFAAQRRVYDGPIAGMGAVPLAPIAARRANGFRFTVRMPRTRDDRYQAASASVRFDWAATAIPSGGSGGSGGGGGSVKPPPDRRAPRLTLTGKRRQRAGKRGLVLYASCDEPCTLRATAKVSGVRGVRRASAKPRALRAAGRRRIAIRVKFTRKALRRLRRPSKRAAVTVTVTARDAAGNRSRARRRIKLRR